MELKTVNGLTMEELAIKLQEPFQPSDIGWRLQYPLKEKKGLAIPFVTGRSIQQRLDDVLTPLGWKNKFIEWKGKSQLCSISIAFESDDKIEWISKIDGADDTDIEGTKGGLSDSMKRSAVQWGIGRYLYKLDKIWVDINVNGKYSYIQNYEYERLNKFLIEQTKKIFSSNNANQANTNITTKIQKSPEELEINKSLKKDIAREKIDQEAFIDMNQAKEIEIKLNQVAKKERKTLRVITNQVFLKYRISKIGELKVKNYNELMKELISRVAA